MTDKIQHPLSTEKIRLWYLKTFPVFAAFVQKQGGNLDEAKEIFQEAIVTYCEKQRVENFSPEESDQAYLYGVAKKRWLKYCRDRKKFDRLNGLEITEENNPQPNSKKILDQLTLTGKKCLDMLSAFYYEKLNMQEMANRFGFRSERSATVQKYKCLEKVREQVKLKSLTYEDFIK